MSYSPADELVLEQHVRFDCAHIWSHQPSICGMSPDKSSLWGLHQVCNQVMTPPQMRPHIKFIPSLASLDHSIRLSPNKSTPSLQLQPFKRCQPISLVSLHKFHALVTQFVPSRPALPHRCCHQEHTANQHGMGCSEWTVHLLPRFSAIKSS